MRYLIFTCLLLVNTGLLAQSGNVFDLGVEFQAYPTGILPGVRAELGFAEKNSVHLRVGANNFNHRDLGVQDAESGGGLGFTLGYKRYLKTGFTGWYGGVRSDVWFNEVNWANFNPDSFGTTDIVVIQPTAEIGHHWLIGKRGLFVTPALAFGFEINVKTEGEPTGEGAIILLGVTIGKRF